MIRKYSFIIVVALAIAFLDSGCSYFGFYTRQYTWQTIFENQPRLTVLQRFAPQDSLLVSGEVVRPEQSSGPLLVCAVSSQYRENEIVALTTVRDPFDEYSLFLPAGDYGFFVFADLNANGLFERNELVGQQSLIVAPEDSQDGFLEGPVIALDYKDPGKTVFRIKVRVTTANYVYPSLDDDFFDAKYGNAGVYNPTGLMAHTQGFIFGLEPYDEQKTMVLFVHGIGGTPRDWKFFVDGLDRTRFQPFFFYYPSGMPLEKLGSLLAEVIDSVDGTPGNRKKIVLAAHSMGGLVSLAAISKLSQERFPPSLKLFCSISTPYGGDEAARKGVENAPVVVPVWRDIATGSEFLRKLTAQPFPTKLPFHLFFTYNDPSTFKLGESSDGTVALKSQLVPAVQSRATRVFGVNESHESVLNSTEARALFLQMLDQVMPSRTVAPE